MNSTTKNFLEFPEERRRRLSQRELSSSPGCVPIVILSAKEWRSFKEAQSKPTQAELPRPTIKRFLINRSSQMFQAITSIQTQWKMTDKQNGVFMYTRCDDKLVNNNATVG